jgi:hypothetical protein
MQAISRVLTAAAAALLVAIAGKAGLNAEAPLPPASGVSGYARQDLPEGPAKIVVQRLCDGCHDLMFTMSTRETEEGWTRIINDMRSRGTDGTEEEFAQVIAYLTTHMGKAEPGGHAALELMANRTKVAPGEGFALGLRLVVAAGWRLKEGAASARSPQVSWTMPSAISIGEPARPVADQQSMLMVIPAVVAASAAAGSTLDLTARFAYEVCRETCLTETATASAALLVGDGGVPSHEEAFTRAGGASLRPR